MAVQPRRAEAAVRTVKNCVLHFPYKLQPYDNHQVKIQTYSVPDYHMRYNTAYGLTAWNALPTFMCTFVQQCWYDAFTEQS